MDRITDIKDYIDQFYIKKLITFLQNATGRVTSGKLYQKMVVRIAEHCDSGDQNDKMSKLHEYFLEQYFS